MELRLPRRSSSTGVLSAKGDDHLTVPGTKVALKRKLVRSRNRLLSDYARHQHSGGRDQHGRDVHQSCPSNLKAASLVQMLIVQ